LSLGWSVLSYHGKCECLLFLTYCIFEHRSIKTMKNVSLTKKRNTEILKNYNAMYFGEMKRDEVIYQELSEKYFMMPKTLYEIVLKESKKHELQSA